MTTRGRAVTRKTRWIDTNISDSLETVTVSTPLSLFAGLGFDDLPGMTVIRQIITLNFVPAPGTAVGAQRMFWGIGIVTGDAFSADALPDLGTQNEEPVRGWLAKGQGVVVRNTGWTSIHTVQQDSRSMRKIDADVELYFQWTNLGMQLTAFDVELQGLIRTLVKLP